MISGSLLIQKYIYFYMDLSKIFLFPCRVGGHGGSRSSRDTGAMGVGTGTEAGLAVGAGMGQGWGQGRGGPWVGMRTRWRGAGRGVPALRFLAFLQGQVSWPGPPLRISRPP